MTSLPDEPTGTEALPPSDQSTCVWLARRLLRSAVRRYQLTLAFAREVDGHFPDAYRNPWSEAERLAYSRKNSDAEWAWPEGERGAWLRLSYEADSAFYAAEVELATRITNLFNLVVPEDKQVMPTPPGREFPERSVMLDGSTFVVLYDPGQYEEGNTIISVSPVANTVILDD